MVIVEGYSEGLEFFLNVLQKTILLGFLNISHTMSNSTYKVSTAWFLGFLIRAWGFTVLFYLLGFFSHRSLVLTNTEKLFSKLFYKVLNKTV